MLFCILKNVVSAIFKMCVFQNCRQQLLKQHFEKRRRITKTNLLGFASEKLCKILFDSLHRRYAVAKVVACVAQQDKVGEVLAAKTVIGQVMDGELLARLPVDRRSPGRCLCRA